MVVQPPSQGGRHVFRTTVGLRWSAPLARDAVWISSGPAAAEQRVALSTRPAYGGGDHRRDAHGRRSPPDGLRLRGVIVVLWRAGLRISEALALAESDLDRTRGAVLVRLGKGGKRREVGMDRWAWEQLDPWLAIRAGLPVGALFCVLRGPTRGRPCSPAGIRTLLRNAAVAAGVRRRFAPHQYADLWVMPIRRGEMLQFDGSAVGRLGLTLGPWRARSMNDAGGQQGDQRRGSATGGALSTPRGHAWQRFRGSAPSARASDEAVHPQEPSAGANRKT